MNVIEVSARLRRSLKINVEFFGFLKNSGWLFFDRLVRLLLGVLVSAWVARYLGPESYGKLAYVFAFLAFFQVLVSVGLDGIVVREISRDQTRTDLVLGTALTLRIATGLLGWLFGTLLVWAIGGFDSAVLFALCAAGLTFQAADTVDLWFQSRSRSVRTVVSKLCAYGISNAAKVLCIVNEAPLTYFAAIASLEVVLSALALYISYKGESLGRPWRFEAERVVPMLKESWPVLVSGLAIIAYLKSDQLMVEHFMGVEALGIYYSAVTLTSLCYFVPVLLNTSSAPFLHRLAASDAAKFDRLMRQYFSAVFVIGVMAFLFLYFLAEPLVLLLYGADYLAAVSVIKVHSLAVVFIFMGSAQNNWLIAKKQVNQMFYRSLITISIGVLLNLWLTPLLGLQGSALSFVVASAVGLFFSNFFINRDLFLAQITCFSFKRYKA
ncbi:PST family polysaccharide transporter [Pseudomonas migulae]|uniref:flippase n=1 Tax=Pseudomonas migulae TaxID=78543 RepID=UPI00209F356A|nr:flippase [Pseudomonas migulae]MCP1498000.1 PST family polysaccharide transporter [Pseudomonas migulae]